MLVYQEQPPARALRKLVECYWFLRGDASGLHPILPDGCAEVVLNLAAPFQRVEPDGRERLQPLRMVVGQIDSAVTVRPTGRVDVVGIRFHPWGARPFLRTAMTALRNELVPLDDLLRFKDRVSPEQTLDERSLALDEALSSMPRGRVPEGDFADAVSTLVSEEGRTSVEELARRMGIGPRQLERRFLAEVGLGPKRFARILRFQSVFRRASEDPRAWAALALECGYYDQSHFIRDFTSFTGASPVRFFAEESPLTRCFTRSGRRSDFSNP